MIEKEAHYQDIYEQIYNPRFETTIQHLNDLPQDSIDLFAKYFDSTEFSKREQLLLNHLRKDKSDKKIRDLIQLEQGFAFEQLSYHHIQDKIAPTGSVLLTPQETDRITSLADSEDGIVSFRRRADGLVFMPQDSSTYLAASCEYTMSKNPQNSKEKLSQIKYHTRNEILHDLYFNRSQEYRNAIGNYLSSLYPQDLPPRVEAHPSSFEMIFTVPQDTESTPSLRRRGYPVNIPITREDLDTVVSSYVTELSQDPFN